MAQQSKEHKGTAQPKLSSTGPCACEAHLLRPNCGLHYRPLCAWELAGLQGASPCHMVPALEEPGFQLLQMMASGLLLESGEFVPAGDRSQTSFGSGGSNARRACVCVVRPCPEPAMMGGCCHSCGNCHSDGSCVRS